MPFDFPINSVKKQTSIADKVLVQSHIIDPDDPDFGQPTFWEYRLDRRIHTKNVKLKFYIVGYRRRDNPPINLIAKWTELEPYELDFFYPIGTTVLPATYRIGFYPYVEEQSNTLVLRLQLVPYPTSSTPGELYIEKLVVEDSDFDAEKSWFNDPDIPTIVPPIDPLDPGPDPKGTDPDPNNVWIP